MRGLGAWCRPEWALLPLALLVLSTHPGRATTADSTQVVGRITIQNLGVFDPQVAQYRQFPYPLLNKLHVRTRSGVIRRELLFAPGSRFDQELVEESARNLRKYRFLGHIALVPAVHADTVNVTVRTEDQWTTNPDVVIDQQGKIYRRGLGFEEENFLGYGKYFNLRFLTSTDRNLVRVIYNDPRLLGSHQTLHLMGIKTSEGELGEVRFAHPQYSLGTSWSFDTGYHYEKGVVRLYDQGELSASVGNQQQLGDMAMTRVWGDRTRQQKLSISLVAERQTFADQVALLLPAAPSAQALLAMGPVSRQNLRLEGRWQLEHVGFIKRRFIDRAGFTEDIKVGQFASLGAGQALGLGGRRDSYALVSASLVESAAIGDNHLAILSVAAGGHVERGQLTNETFEAFYHHYYQGLPHQTIAFSAAGDLARDMDQPFQLVLGGDIGLRGYPARQFTGDRFALFNLEDQVFTPVEVATLRLGFAAFGDAGMVWPAGRAWRWRDLRPSAGISLRLGVIKFAGNPVFRLDLARPLRRSQGMDRYAIGFSFSPVFWTFGGPDAIVKRFR